MILILQLGLMQQSQLWDFRHGDCSEHHKNRLSAHTQTYTHTLALCLSLSLTHIATDCGPVDLWCVNSTIFFMRGLDKQYSEPINCYAEHYPIRCNTFLPFPVTQAVIWHTRSSCTKQRRLHRFFFCTCPIQQY